MVRQPTLCELAALDVLTRQLAAIQRQFNTERLARCRDVDQRDAMMLGRHPFVLGRDGLVTEQPSPGPSSRRRAGQAR